MSRKNNFIDRGRELLFLNEKYRDSGANLLVIYGKRRVGKTALIKQFIREKEGIYYLADRRAPPGQLREIGRLFGAYFRESLPTTRGFADWLEALRYLSEKIRGRRFIFAVDEFPYLCEADRSVSSQFQKGWDEYLKQTGVFLIISGSSLSMMDSEVLGYKAPLYGRRTGQIQLKPMGYKNSAEFFPNMPFDRFIQLYAITGGMPSYLTEIDPSLSVKKNITEKIFPPRAFLHNEIEFLLKEELREPKNYLSILSAISHGCRRFGEIVNDSGIEKNILTKYLRTLESLQMIEREVPVTEPKPLKSKKGLYTISDNFIRFWFRYIFPHRSQLEMEKYAEVLRKIDENFVQLTSNAYESIAREIMWELSEEIFEFERIGKWWEREQEIDIVGFNKEQNRIIFGEVKWSNKPVGTDLLDKLINKSSLVKWGNDARINNYILFSKSGFTANITRAAKERGIFLVEQDSYLT